MRHWTAKFILLSLILKVLVGTAHAALPAGDADRSGANSLIADLAVICTAYGVDGNAAGSEPGAPTAWDQENCSLCLLYQGSAPADLDVGRTFETTSYYTLYDWPGQLARLYHTSALYLPIGQRAPPHTA